MTKKGLKYDLIWLIGGSLVGVVIGKWPKISDFGHQMIDGLGGEQ